jgi:F-type H+-transporting ATPase subunit b
MGEVFTRRLREMDAGAKAAFGGALKASTGPAIVRSTFDLGPVQRAAIQNALNEDFSANIALRFETDKDTVCGVELTANGQKVSWSIAGYLTSLEKKVDALIESESPPDAAAPAPHPVDAPALGSVA